jgi:hypothetical protein
LTRFDNNSNFEEKKQRSGSSPQQPKKLTSMLTQHIALIDQSKSLHAAELAQAAAALQKQATRDLGPIWGVRATVDTFPTINKMPVGYWPIIITERIDDPNAAGYHADKHHQPYAMVQLENGWATTCSHELCEMLVDPFGNRLVASDSIKKGQGRVKYLIEVCDPSEGAEFGYSVNGVLLSDFYTPHYFDPISSPATRYSFTGALTKPREVKKGGYLSWYDPQSNSWFQATFFGTSLQIQKLTGMQERGASLRSQIDRLTKDPGRAKALTIAHKNNLVKVKSNEASAEAEGSHWRQEIERHFKK